MKPKVSIIIPTFNRFSRLKQAVDSILLQTYRDFELIVVDDGSTDRTRELFENCPPQVFYVFQKNKGVAAARNEGINKARGQWLAFLDSDDTWLPEKLARQMAFHQKNPDIKISQTEEVWIRNGKRVNPMKKHKKVSGWIFEPCLRLCLISPSSVILAREVFDRVGIFDESFPVCEDYELWLRCTLRYAVGLVDNTLVIKHGGHEDQLSKRYWGMDRLRILALEKILGQDGLSAGQRESCLRELTEKCRIYALGCKKRNRSDEFTEFSEKPLRITNTP